MPSEKFRQAVELMARQDRFFATVYSMNTLLVEKGIYTQDEFEKRFLDWGERECPAATRVRPSIRAISEVVANHFEIEPEHLKLKSNVLGIVYPRQIVMYLARQLTLASMPEIGRTLGGKHHTTVLHSVEKIGKMRKTNQQLNSLLANLTAMFETKCQKLQA